MKIILIGIGGAIGAVARYIVCGLDYKFSNGIFPLGTLVVNLSGSLIIGFLWGLFEQVVISSHLRMFIFMGILGGYTTFSTFALENFNLFRDGEKNIAFFNIILSNLGGIIFVFIGYALSRIFINFMK
ncbi:fluoride efflux transporter CrcB [bacterium]|nr:MAG: fluoride efflux transporter CrcB [bacterium]